jgi:hypothetical protein
MRKGSITSMHSSEAPKTPVFTKENVPRERESINSQPDYASEVSIMDIEKGEFIGSYRNSPHTEIIKEVEEFNPETNIFSTAADPGLQSNEASNSILG